jgi:hypothetical protein
MKSGIKTLIGIIIFISMITIILSYESFFSKWFSKEDSNTVLKDPVSKNSTNIIFLHHSTGKNIWDGGIKEWFKNYNQTNKVNYSIIEQNFPKKSPYGWANYPFDYWNIWVKHAGEEPYKEEPTLEMITKKYDIVIWKHCFPVGNIEEDVGESDVNSEIKRLENYKVQYEALKEKMKKFNQTKFIIWTTPSLVEKKTTEEKASRLKEFYNWVKNEWDEKGDNIYLWDFYELETVGGLYLKNEYATSQENSHPNKTFSKKVAPYFCQRIVDVIEGRADNSSLTGKIQ